MKILIFLIKITVLIGLIALGFYLWPEKISGEQQQSAQKISLVKTAFNFLTDKSEPLQGENRDRVNILFLGLPGVGNDAPNLTDTIILLSIRPSDNRLALLSLPRDLLVKVPKRGTLSKINALFEMGRKDPSMIKEKVAEITGQQIDYYIALDVSGVEKIIDILGGLNVWVAEDVFDPQFPTPGHGTEYFTVKKGWRYFDGKTVQKYLRTRHSADGDFARMRQQQAVIEALRKKIFGLNLLYDFPTAFSIFKTTRDSMQTDLDESNLKRLYDIAKNISYDNVIHKVVDGNPKDQNALLESKTIELGGKPAFVLVPKKSNYDYSEIQALARNIFDN
ncbi:MAG: LCP family protein [Patescibacteria group bacterium]